MSMFRIQNYHGNHILNLENWGAIAYEIVMAKLQVSQHCIFVTTISKLSIWVFILFPFKMNSLFFYKMPITF